MNSSNHIANAIADLELRKRSSPVDEYRTIVWEWAAQFTGPTVSDSDVHAIITIRDLLLSAMVSGTQLVIVLHGIRDQGAWMEMIKDRLGNDRRVVQPLDFDFYDSVRFMIGYGVRRIIRLVTNLIRDAVADHPGAELVIIAHSFGTHVACKILLNEPDIRCSRLIMCGAVVSKSFPFRRITRPPRILNDCGGRDIWPIVAQGFNLRMLDRYGASGVWGIRRPGIEDRFHDFGHSDYLKAEFVDKYWKPFIESGEVVKNPFQAARRDIHWGVSLLAYGWWIVLVGVVGILAGFYFSPLLGYLAIALTSVIILVILCGVWKHLHPIDDISSPSLTSG